MRAFLAAALLAPPLLLGAAADAQAQGTLVSNLAQARVTDNYAESATSFRTGGSGRGYTLSAVDIRLGPGADRTFAVAVYQGDPRTGTRLFGLNPPGSPQSNAVNTFTAPANTTLAANTTYWLVFNDQRRTNPFSSNPSVSTTINNGQTGKDGWSISNNMRETRGTTPFSASIANSIIFAIKGARNILPAPADYTLTAGDRQAVASWTDPGDSTITKYQYKTGTAGDGVNFGFGPWIDIPGSGAKTTSYTFKGLKNGETYVLLVRAVAGTFGGEEPLPHPKVTPRWPAPQGLIATAGSRQVTLAWNDYDGGVRLTRYQYQQRIGDGGWGPWINILGASAGTVTFSRLGLKNGTRYSFRIRGAVGPSATAASGIASATPTAPAPAAPDGLTASPGKDQVLLRWKDPGNRDIAKYQYQVTAPDAHLSDWIDIPGSGAATTSHTVGGLTNGEQRIFWVRAFAGTRAGAPSSVAASPIAAPAAPTGLRADAYDEEVTVTWDDPDNSTITKYQFSIAVGDRVYPWANIPDSGAGTTSHTVRERKIGDQLTIRVRAFAGTEAGAESSVAATAVARAAPAAPVGLTAAALPRRVILKWNRGDPSITKYQYQQRVGNTSGAWTDIPDSGAGATSHTVADLTNGTTYGFRIRAFVRSVAGTPSAEVTATPAASAHPAAPTGLHITPGDGQVILRWDDPGHNEITKYRYKLSRATIWDNNWTDIPDSAGATSHTVTGLTNGTRYNIALEALVGTLRSEEVQTGPFLAVRSSPPAAPAGFKAVPGNGLAALSWDAPGNRAINKYQYRFLIDGRWQPWTDIPDSAGATSHTVTNLTNGKIYGFMVRAFARSAAGTSSLIATVIPNAPPAPAAPAGLTATPGDGRVTLNWNDSGNRAITKYQYKASTAGKWGARWIDIPDSGAGTTSHTVAYLTNGTTYGFALRALAGSVEGAESISADVTPKRATTPAAPTGLKASPGDGRVTLSWNDPGNDDITKHQYQIFIDASTNGLWIDIPDTTTYTHTVTGLVNDKEYVFVLRALAGSVEGPKSTGEAATPKRSAAPAVPTGLKASPGSRRVALSWDDPGNDDITKYQYQTHVDGEWLLWHDIPGSNAATTAFTVAGLANNKQYRFRIRAFSGSLQGTATAEVNATPKGLAAPTGLTATPGDGQVTLRWDDPGNRGITGYQFRIAIRIDPDDPNEFGWTGTYEFIPNSGAKTTSHTVTGLDNGKAYRFGLRALAGAEASEHASSWPPATPSRPAAPAAPAGFKATPGDKRVVLSWNDPLNNTITRYQYRMRINGTWLAQWNEIPDSGAATTTFTLDSLTNGAQYAFRLRAVAGPVRGSTSAEAGATPMGPPAKPTGLTITSFYDGFSNSAAAELGWTDPGDSTITKWQLRRGYVINSLFRWYRWIDIDLSELSPSDYYLTIGGIASVVESVRIQLRAVRGLAVGEAAETEAFTPVDASYRPAKPVGLTATAGDGEITLRWTDPQDGNITKWWACLGGGGCEEVPDSTATTTSHTITGLINGNPYDVFIYATRGTGRITSDSQHSDTLQGVTPLATPAKPAGLTAMAGAAQVILNWTDPSNSDIGKYQVRQGTGDPLAWEDWTDIAGSGATTTSHAVAGLTNGTAYRFELRAVAGTTVIGASSDTVSATPLAGLAKPAGFTATAGNTQVTLRWDGSSESGITKYQYLLNLVNAGTWSAWTDIQGSGAATTSHTVVGLTNGLEYRFRVRAVVGTMGGEPSDFAAAMPEAAAPAAPAGLTATPGDREVALAWDDPDNSAITKYQYRHRLNNSGGSWSAWADIPDSGAATTGHTVAFAADDARRSFEVRAFAGSLAGAASAVTLAPAAPAGLTATPGDREVALAWDDPDNSAITKYQFRFNNGDNWSDWTDIAGSGAATTSHTAAFTMNGVRRRFELRAFVGPVAGPASAQVEAFTSTGEAPVVAEPLLDRPATAGQAFSYQFAAGTFTDADDDALTYTATRGDDSALPAWLTFTAATRTFAGTPQLADVGTLTVKVTAEDGDNTVADAFDITVLEAVAVSLAVSGGGVATEGAAALTVSAIRSAANASGAALTIPIAVNATDTSAQANDYTVAASISIPDGARTGTTTFTVADDSTDEPPETVVLELGTLPDGHTASGSSVAVTIIDNDPTPATLAGATGDVAEGEAKIFTVTLGRAPASGETLSVPLAFGGAATRGTDYTVACPSPLPGGVACDNLNTGDNPRRVNFTGPGADDTWAAPTSVTLTLTAVRDDEVEADETVTVGFDAKAAGEDPGGGVAGTDNLADFAITNAGAVPPTLRLFPSVSTTLPEGTQAQRMTLGLSRNLTDADVDTLEFPIMLGGSAARGTDYTLSCPPGTLGPGVTCGNLDSGTPFLSIDPAQFGKVPRGAQAGLVVNVIEDDTEESDETLTLTTSGGTVTLTLTDAPDSVTVRFNTGGDIRFAVNEIQGPAQPVIRLDRATGKDLTFPLSYSGTATRDVDYRAPDSFTIKADGDLTQSLPIYMLPDEDGGDESTETIVITLGAAPPGAVKGTPDTATVFVFDADPTPVTLAGESGDIIEGRGKTFTVTLGRGLVAGEKLPVRLAFGGTAERGADYTVACPSSPPNGVSCASLNSGDNPRVIFAGPGEDDGWTASATQVTLTLTAAEDAALDDAETVTIGLGELGDPSLGGGATGTDRLADFSITDVAAVPPTLRLFPSVSTSLPEGTQAQRMTLGLSRNLTDADADTLEFPITLGGSAARGTDYTLSCPPGTLDPGVTCGNLDSGTPFLSIDPARFDKRSRGARAGLVVNVIEDDTEESGETLTLTTSGGTVALTLTDAPASVTVGFTQPNFLVSEIQGPAQPVIRLDRATGKDLTLPLVYTGTATRGVDYSAPDSFTIKADGDLTQSFNIPMLLHGPGGDELNETIVITLGALPPGAVKGAQGTATVTILDADPTQVTLAGPNGDIIEGRGKTFTVTLGRGLVAGESLRVPLTFGGVARRSVDYSLACPSSPPNGVTCHDLNDVSQGNNPRVTFTGPGEGDGWTASAAEVELTLSATRDAAVEGAETLMIGLGALGASGLGGGATGTDNLADFSITDLLAGAPGAPAGFTAAEGGGGTIILGWNNPSNSDITKYQYRQGTGSPLVWGAWTDIPNSVAATTSHTVTGLTNGTAYSFEVRAVADAVLGTPSDTASATPVARPARIIGLTATAGVNAVRLSWTDPGNSGINGYQYRTSEDNGVNWSDWTNIADSGATTTSHTVASLTNGTAYRFQVRARSGTSTVGRASDEASATPVAAPAAPAKPGGFTATPGDGEVVLSWTDPVNSNITGYQYALRTGSAWGAWTRIPGSGAATNSHKVTGLAKGVQYGFRIRAVAALSVLGAESDVATATPNATPLKPAGFAAAAGDERVTLTWTDPSNAAISKWQVRRGTGSPLDWGEWTDIASSGAATTSHTVTGLTNGTPYSFELRAVAGTALGAASDTVAATPVAPPRPAAPTGFKVTAGDGQVFMSWNKAEEPDYSHITGYAYRTQNFETKSWFGWSYVIGSDADTTSYTAGGLTNGLKLGIQMRALAGSSLGEDSETLVFTPFATPAKPTGLTAAASSQQAVLTWADPSNSDITKYQYRQGTGSGTIAWGSWMDIPESGATTTTHTATGLINGEDYNFQVRAVAGAVLGSVSDTATAMPTAPAAPAVTFTGPGDGQVVLRWTDPDNDHITAYQYRTRSGGNWGSWANISLSDTIGPSQGQISYVLTGLTNGTRYGIRIRAVAGTAFGAASDTVTATPNTPPAGPAGLTAKAGHTQVVLTWTDPENNAITKYQVSLSVTVDGVPDIGAWKDIADSTATTTTHTVTGLTNGTEYTIRIRAVVGEVAGISSSATATPVASTVSLSVSASGAITEGGSALTLTATRSDANTSGAALGIPIQVKTAGTTAQTNDYTVAASISIPDNASSGTTTFAAADDTDDEPPETVVIEFGTLPAGTVKGSTAEVTITVADNDPTAVTLAGAAGDIAEGGTKSFTVTLGRGLIDGEALPVPLTFGGAAARKTDYTVACPLLPPTGVTCHDLDNVRDGSNPRVTFTGPSTGTTATSVTLTLSATRDATRESAETVAIGLGALNASSGTGLGGGAAGTDSLADFAITDAAAPPVALGLAANFGSTLPEGTTTIGGFNWFLSRALGTSDPASLSFPITLGGSAARGTDYTLSCPTAPPQPGLTCAISGDGDPTLTIDRDRFITARTPRGEIYLTINVLEDSTQEPDETLTLTPSGGRRLDFTLTDAPASVEVKFTVSEFVVSESNPPLTLVIALDRPTGRDLTFPLMFTPGTAMKDADYTELDDITIKANGRRIHEFGIPFNTNDSLDEITETFTVALGAAPTGATKGTPTTATVRIDDKDPTRVTLAGTAGNVAEGGMKTFTVALGRGLVSGETLPVPLAFGGAATRGADYTVACPQTLPTGVTCNDLDTAATPTVTFTGPSSGATATAVTLTLTATSDGATESGGETVDIGFGKLGSGTGLDGGAVGADRLADFLITDNAVAGVTTAQPEDQAVTEGDTTDTATFTVALNTRPSADVTVTVTAPAGLELDGPDAGGVFASSEALTFTAANWSTAQTVTLRATDDNVDSPSRRELAVTYSTSSQDTSYHSRNGTAATVTVADNDPTTVTLAGAAGDIAEGRAKTFTITLNRGLVGGETLKLPLTFGGTATRATDYTVACPTTLPDGVWCGHLNYVGQGNDPRVVFTGPSTGATDTTVTLTLSAVADGAAEAGGETVDIGFGPPQGPSLEGGVSGTDSLATFRINDPPAPAAPTGFTAAAGDASGEVDLGWTDPSNNAITKYQFRQGTGLTTDSSFSWGEWTDIPSSGAGTTSHTVTGLTDGTLYSFQVRAVVGTVFGAMSDTASATPTVPLPAALTGLAATAGAAQVTVSWTDPNDSSITKYELQQRAAGGAWGASVDVLASWTSVTRSGLTNGTEYEFRLRAVNATGDGPWTSVSATPLAANAPAQPTGFTATAGASSVTLSWTAPGGTITGYEIRQGTGDPVIWGAWGAISGSSSSTASTTVGGLTVGTAYSFQIRAVNNAVKGAMSDTASATPVAATVGFKSAILTATENTNLTVTLALSRAVSAAVDVYLTSTAVTATRGSDYAAGTVTSPDGTTGTYKVTITAGQTEGSTTIAITDDTIAEVNEVFRLAIHEIASTVAIARGATTTSEVIVSDDTDTAIALPDPATLTVTEASGSTRTGTYNVKLQVSPNGTETVTVAVASRDASVATVTPASLTFTDDDWNTGKTVTVTGVDDEIDQDADRTVAIRHTATSDDSNSLYAGRASADLTVTVTDNDTAPAAPAGFTAAAGDQQVALSWTDPSNSAIDSWQFRQRTPPGNGAWGSWTAIASSTATTTTHTVTGLTNGTAYGFQVRAVDGTLQGAASAEATATPAPPVTVAFAAGSTAVTVAEGDDSHAELTLALSAARGAATPVRLISVGTSASAHADFAAGPYTVDFPAGDTEATLRIAIMDDNVPESGASEAFNVIIVALGLPGGVAVGTPSEATVTIRDDDTPHPAPTGLTATPGAGSVGLAWSYAPPAVDRTADFQYRQRTPPGTGTWSAWTIIPGSDADTRSHTVTGLTGGTEYAFEVRARSRPGGGFRPGVSSDTARATPAAATLAGKVRTWMAESSCADECGARWKRALKALGETGADLAGVEPMTYGEALERYVLDSAQRARWEEVALALRALEAERVVVTIAASPAGPVTEGAELTFTLTAAAASSVQFDLFVTVADAPGSDFLDAADEGRRRVTLPLGETSVEFKVATRDDGADEPDGTVTATVNAVSSVYKLGSPAVASVQVIDNDGPGAVDTFQRECPATSADLIKTVRGYYTHNQNRAERNFGENWRRVLIAFGEERHATLKPYTAAEARASEAIWPGWRPVREELERLEACPERPAPPPPNAPRVTVTTAATGPAAEGTALAFTLTASAAPTENLTVAYTVSDAPGADFVAAEHEGAKTAVIRAGETSVDIAVATAADTADEPSGAVSVTVDAGSGYAPGTPILATAAVTDDDATQVTLAGSADAIAEAGGTKTFTVTLGRGLVSGETLLVPLAFTGAATRGTDYTLACPTPLPTGVACNALDTAPTPTVTFTGPSTGTTATSVTLTLTATEDTTVEAGGETVMVGLGPLGASSGTGLGGGASGTDNLADFTITDDDGSLPEVTVAAAGAGVTEGTAASFTLTISPAPTAALTVQYTVSDVAGSDFLLPGEEGAKTVDFAIGETSKTLSVPTVADTTDEADGPVTVQLTAGDGYQLGAPASARVTVMDDDAPPVGLTVSIGDATVSEGRTMEFPITLSAPAPGLTLVFWRTREVSPVSARQNVDYRGRDWVMFFYEGEQTKQAPVPTVNDAHDEGDETFEVVIDKAAPFRGQSLTITKAVATGTITNSDPLPAAYLARFGRTVAEQALEGIAGRMAAPRTPGTQGTLAGQALAFGPPAPGDAAEPLDDGLGLDGPQEQSSTMTAQEALLGSRFTLTGAADATGGSLAFWGRASRNTFDGTERGTGTAITLDGTVTTGLLGADYARDDWLFGLALTHSSSDGHYASEGASGNGDLEASLTAALPYASFRATPRLKLWGAAGLGAGEVTVKTPNTRYRADTEWTMAAAGLRGDLLTPPAEGAGAALALTADALWTRTTSDRTRGLAASDADVTRLRLGLESSYPLALDGDGKLTPRLEAGARHDGGDAETGRGFELGGGLAFSAPTLGLTLDLSGRTLIAHTDDDLKDRGYQASLAFDPDPATKRGPSLGLRQDFGGRAEGGLDALFASAPLGDRTGSGAKSRWTMEAAWGLSAFGGRFTASPHAGLGLAADAREISLGWRLTPEASTAPDLSLGLKAARRERNTAVPEHTFGVEATLRW